MVDSLIINALLPFVRVFDTSILYYKQNKESIDLTIIMLCVVICLHFFPRFRVKGLLLSLTIQIEIVVLSLVNLIEYL